MLQQETAYTLRSSDWSSDVCSSDLPRLIKAHSKLERYVLGIEILVDTLGSAFTAEARFLHATERRRSIGDRAAIDADHAGVQLGRDAHRPVDVAGVEVRHEAVLGVVRSRDRFVFGVETDHCRNGSEDLFLQEARIGGQLIQNGRGEEKPGTSGHRHTGPTESDLGPSGSTGRDSVREKD